MNFSNIKLFDIANGTGVRVTLFVSGCPHHCKGCFNPETWEWKNGKEFTAKEEETILKQLDKEYIAGLSLLGGEPFAQDSIIIELARKAKEKHPEKPLWAYSGFTYEEIKEHPLLNYVDVLVDGRFNEECKNLKLRFRGSDNQRIIDVKATKNNNDVVVWLGGMK